MLSINDQMWKGNHTEIQPEYDQFQNGFNTSRNCISLQKEIHALVLKKLPFILNTPSWVGRGGGGGGGEAGINVYPQQFP